VVPTLICAKPAASVLRFSLLSLFIFGFSNVEAGERGEWPPRAMRNGDPLPGPLVEVSPRGKPAYAACLTKFKDGLITLTMFGGETRQEVASEIATLRFNPENPPGPPRRREDGPPPYDDRPPRPEDGRPPPPKGRDFNDDDLPPPKDGKDAKDGRRPGEMLLRRLRALQDREQREELTVEEVDELRRMRETVQLFPNNTSSVWRVSTARQAARQAARAGKLDEHIQSMQKKMWDAANYNEVRDALVMLGHGYVQRDGADFPAVVKKLQADIANIKNPNLREEFQKHPPDMIEFLREPKNDFGK
jgi:hypothetical protein